MVRCKVRRHVPISHEHTRQCIGEFRDILLGFMCLYLYIYVCVCVCVFAFKLCKCYQFIQPVYLLMSVLNVVPYNCARLEERELL